MSTSSQNLFTINKFTLTRNFFSKSFYNKQIYPYTTSVMNSFQSHLIMLPLKCTFVLLFLPLPLPPTTPPAAAISKIYLLDGGVLSISNLMIQLFFFFFPFLWVHYSVISILLLIQPKTKLKRTPHLSKFTLKEEKIIWQGENTQRHN